MLGELWQLISSDVFNLLITIISFIIVVFIKKIKNIYETKITDETKRNVIKTVVKAVEQIYYDLSGSEKLQKAKENIINMLNEKGITISELELDMMIEEICNSIKKETFENE